MEKKWPEIIISSVEDTQAVSRACKAGILRKIAPKIYTSNQKDSPEEIIARHRYQIVSELYPEAVISHRSALEGGVSPDQTLTLTYKYTRNIELPGLKIRLLEGPGPDQDDSSFLEKLYIASRARAYLENMQPSRSRESAAKTLSREEIEERLERLIRIYGESELNLLRDQAREVAYRLGMEKEYRELYQLIGALLGTRSSGSLKTEAGRSRAAGEPFDSNRIELFAALAHYLHQKNFAHLPVGDGITNEAFFEAYFSNYIEGTRFAVEEAEEIVFKGRMIPNRSEDSHDILSTFQIITQDHAVPKDADHFIELLRQRHGRLMESRKDKRPGEFKNEINRAGDTLFVLPTEVTGTFRKGFQLYSQLPTGMARAVFMMFLVSEVHPFLDGNGRIARLFMNAELEGSCRIIIPTVYRDDYILTLRRFSRQGDPKAFVRMLAHAQKYTASIPFQNYKEALAYLERTNAFKEPNEAKLIMEPGL